MELQQQIRLLDFKQTPKCPTWTDARCIISQMGRCIRQTLKAARPRQHRLFQDQQLFIPRQLQCRWAMETPSTITSFRQPSCRKVVEAWAVLQVSQNDGTAPVTSWWRHRLTARLPHCCKITETQRSHCSIYSQKIVRMVCSSMGELSCNIALFIFLWSPWTRHYTHTHTCVSITGNLMAYLVHVHRCCYPFNSLHFSFGSLIFQRVIDIAKIYTLTCRHITVWENSAECVVE